VTPDKGLPDPSTVAGSTVVGANIFDGSFPLPTAVLLEDALAHNIATMADYCAANGVLLAPHGKTTMCPQIIRRQLEAGAWAVTVATAWQAATVAEMGVPRLILANEVVDPGSVRLLSDLLGRQPELEIYAYTDSDASLKSLVDGIDPAHRSRLRLLVELGFHSGRTGLRSDDDALDLAWAVAGSPFALAGVAAFEGIMDAGDLPATLELVDRLLDRMVDLALTANTEGVVGDVMPIVTVGGSAYFDRVVERLPAALAGSPYRTVLRSGCYVTHDAGHYDSLSPFGAVPRAAQSPVAHRFREALRVWAPVLSRPEPTLALAGAGRRDMSTDSGLPVPRTWRATDGRLATLDGVGVTGVNDQHAYLSVPAEHPLAVGDLVGFGISHPCTTFDKWRSLPVVSADGTVLELAQTRF
jgi:D-serine dehydratase